MHGFVSMRKNENRKSKMEVPEQCKKMLFTYAVLRILNLLNCPDGKKDYVQLLGEEENILGFDVSDTIPDLPDHDSMTKNFFRQQSGFSKQFELLAIPLFFFALYEIAKNIKVCDKII